MRIETILVISFGSHLQSQEIEQTRLKPEPYHWDEMKIGPGAPPREMTPAILQSCSTTMGWGFSTRLEAEA